MSGTEAPAMSGDVVLFIVLVLDLYGILLYMASREI